MESYTVGWVDLGNREKTCGPPALWCKEKMTLNRAILETNFAIQSKLNITYFMIKNVFQLFVPGSWKIRSPSWDFPYTVYSMYCIGRMPWFRTRDAATAARCFTNELHTSRLQYNTYNIYTQKHAEHLRQYTEDVRDRRRETGHMRQETKRQVTLDTRRETGDMAGDVRQET